MQGNLIVFPERHRIQRGLDRRFYHRKYDAAKTLAALSATLQQEMGWKNYASTCW